MHAPWLAAFLLLAAASTDRPPPPAPVLNRPRQDAALPLSAPLQQAVTELMAVLRQHYPNASFDLRRGTQQPEDVFLVVYVATSDLNAVLRPILTRLLQLQLEEGLPLYVLPRQP